MPYEARQLTLKAATLRSQGLLSEAEELCREALEIQELRLGLRDNAVAETLVKIASLRSRSSGNTSLLNCPKSAHRTTPAIPAAGSIRLVRTPMVDDESPPTGSASCDAFGAGVHDRL